MCNAMEKWWDDYYEWWVGKYLEEPNHGVFEGNNPRIILQKVSKSTKNSIRISYNLAEIWTAYLPPEYKSRPPPLHTSTRCVWAVRDCC
jgi:hypothetical protein